MTGLAPQDRFVSKTDLHIETFILTMQVYNSIVMSLI